jgi:hypothetical protein
LKRLLFKNSFLVPAFKGVSESNKGNVNANPLVTVSVTNMSCLVIGAITLLKQFNPDFRNQFIAILAQYVRSGINLNSIQKSSELIVEVSRVVSFLEEFIDFSHLDRKVNKIIHSLFINFSLILLFLIEIDH